MIVLIGEDKVHSLIWYFPLVHGKFNLILIRIFADKFQILVGGTLVKGDLSCGFKRYLEAPGVISCGKTPHVLWWHSWRQIESIENIVFNAQLLHIWNDNFHLATWADAANLEIRDV